MPDPTAIQPDDEQKRVLIAPPDGALPLTPGRVPPATIVAPSAGAVRPVTMPAPNAAPVLSAPPTGSVSPSTITSRPATVIAPPDAQPQHEGFLSSLMQRENKIKNPVLRNVAKAGTGLARGVEDFATPFVPEIAFVPGTEANATARNNQDAKARMASVEEAQKLATAENQGAQAYKAMHPPIDWRNAAPIYSTDAKGDQTQTGERYVDPNDPTNQKDVMFGPQSGGASASSSPVTYGAPKAPIDPAKQPAAANLVSSFAGDLQKEYPDLTPEQVTSLQNELGQTPTQGTYEKVVQHADQLASQSANRKDRLTQQQFNNQERESMDDLRKQMAELTMQGKEQQVKQTADGLYYGLYDQQNYKDAMDAWYKSGHWKKDSGLIAEQVGTPGEEGADGRAGMNFDIFAGMLARTPAGAIGAMTAGELLNRVAPVMQGYLDTLTKAGISTKGHDALQAYTQAVLSRLQFDMQLMGAKASTMRMRDMIRLAMQNVPQPNLEKQDFNSRFGMYEKRMEGQIKRATPPNYEPPPNPYAGEQGGQSTGNSSFLQKIGAVPAQPE